MEWIYTCVAISPLIFCPKVIFNAFALPQTLAVSLLSTASLAIGVGAGVLPHLSSTPIGLCFAFLIFLFLTTLWTFPHHNAKKEIGLQVPLVLLFLTGTIWLTRDKMLFFMLPSVIAATLSATYGVFQTYKIDPFFSNKNKAGGPVTNPIGTIGNPNFLTAYLCGNVWLGLYLAIEIHFLFVVVALFMAYVVLFKAKNRAGLLALSGSFLFFFLMVCYFEYVPYGRDVFNLTVALLVMFVLFSYTFFKMNWYTFWHKKIDPQGPGVWFGSFRYRLCYWWAAIHLIKQKPIFGWGLWTYRREVYKAQAELEQQYPGYLDKERYITPQPRECHNDYLEHLVEYGLVGFLLFMVFVGSVVYFGWSYMVSVSTPKEFFLILVLLTSLLCLLIDAFFFFALRIPSSAIMFWMNCVMILSFVSPKLIWEVQISYLWGILVAVMCAGFIWECVLKRTIASRYFYLFLSADHPFKKTFFLMQLLKYAPQDSMYRTHATIYFNDTEPVLAKTSASKMIEFFDGQTPLWCALFNMALTICKNSRNALEEATTYLKASHFVLNYFQPTLDLLNGRESVTIRSKYRGGTAMVRISDDGTVWRIRALIERAQSCQKDLTILQQQIQTIQANMNSVKKEIDLCQSHVENAILLEKKRLNLPDTWVYNPESGEFKEFSTLSAEEKKNIVGGPEA